MMRVVASVPARQLDWGPRQRSCSSAETDGMVADQIAMSAGAVQAVAKINETPTARAVLDALPLSGRASTWGDEVCFSITANMPEEDAQAVVSIGTGARRPVP